MDLAEAYKVRFIELIDDSFYNVFLVNNRWLRGDGKGGREQGRHRRESGNWHLEHDEYYIRVPAADASAARRLVRTCYVIRC
jgi:hypothetical protein